MSKGKIILISIFVVSASLFVSIYFLLSPNQWDKIYMSALGTGECIDKKGLTFKGDCYDGPLIDTHYHIASIPESLAHDQMPDEVYSGSPVLGHDIAISDSVCHLKLEGTKKVFAFFPVYTEMYEQHIAATKVIMDKYSEWFVPFIMPPDDDNAIDGSPTVDVNTLKDMLSLEPNLFEGYGEIGLYAREGGALELKPDSQRLNDIYPVVKDKGLLIYFHLEMGQAEVYKKAIAENPDINFIFHGDQLIPPMVNDVQDLTLIEDVISSSPNVYYTVDELYGDEYLIKPGSPKEKFLNHLDDYEELLKKDFKSWKGIIEKYPTRFMWGTDRNADTMWSLDVDIGHTLTNYGRAFIAGLDPEVQENFAYKNAESLLKD